MITLAETLLLAAKIREDSYDLEADTLLINHNTVADYSQLRNYSQFYTITIYEACKLAIAQNKCDPHMIHLIYMLLLNNWNESLTWARVLIEEN